MAEIKNVVFRSALGGYNKEDVNSYLIQMSGEFNEREEALRERAVNAEAETKELDEKISELSEAFESKKNELESEIEKLKLENAELSEREPVVMEISSSDNEQKLFEQEAVISRQFEEIERLREETERLRAEKLEAEEQSAKCEEFAKKAQLYDKTSANIGDAIISARKTAEEIICAAKEEAAAIIEKAEKELYERRRNLEESSADVFESIFSKLHAAAAENRKEVASASSYSAQLWEKAASEIRARNENVNTRLKNYEENLWKSIKNDLESIRNTEKSEQVKNGMKKCIPENSKRLKK